MTFVYRVEHKCSGKGPYSHPWNSKSNSEVFIKLCNSRNRHKTIKKDKLVKGNKFR